MLCVIQGGFWKNLVIFLRDWVDSAPEVDSRPALLPQVVPHIVDNGSGVFHTGFAGIHAPRAVFPTIAHSWHGEVCTVDASPAEQFFIGNLDNISMSPLFLADIFSSQRCASGFFGSPR